MVRSRISELVAIGIFSCMAASEGSFGEAAISADRVAYEVRVIGVQSNRLRTALERQAQTFQNRKRPPGSLRQLAHRAQGDVPRLEDVLRSQGYYEAKVAVIIDDTRSPVDIRFAIDPGPVYRIGRWSVVFDEVAESTAPPPIFPQTADDRPAEAAAILATEQGFLRRLCDEGYPLCRAAGREVALDASDRAVHLTTRIIPGPRADFGHVEIHGLEGVHESYVRRRIRWKRGDPYRHQLTRDLEKDLLHCGLFASARVHSAETVDAHGQLPISITLHERKHRTVRVGGTYVSDEQGFGGQVSWEHRNLLGEGRRLWAELAASQIDWRQTTGYVHPDLWRRNLDLLLDLEVSAKHPEAFDSESFGTGATLQYYVDRWHMRFWGGTAQEASIVEQLAVQNRYHFVELPLGLDWDRRDDPLDAGRGWRFLVQSVPHIDARSDLRFIKNYAEGRYFHSLGPQGHTVVAGRVGLGLISGADLSSVPADKRFYAGGAGSVRGYAYQSIGPALNGTPLGGLSLIETSLELRTSWGSKFGTVLFLDGGTVMSGSFQGGDEEPMRWGAGLGLRYSLGFAPLRFDVAFPLNRQEDDREYQFYVSIGQAF